MKRLQNKVAESRLALPVTAVIAVAVWLLVGLVQRELWVQFGCFAVTTYLMVELNNSNALIRIYSRTVSCAFLLLSCVASFTFIRIEGAITELCAVASYITIFRTYQDRRSPGWTYYSFLCIGLASLVYVHILYYAPIMWLLMASRLNSMSWRTFAASLFGLLTPYWFVALYLLYIGDATPAVHHLSGLWAFGTLCDVGGLGIPQMLTFSFVVVLAAMGAIHYVRTSYNDKIRIRMFYSCFLVVNLFTVVFLVLQPLHYDLLIRIMIVNTSPLIAHFVALTHTRMTNIAFIATLMAVVALTVVNMWLCY